MSSKVWTPEQVTRLIAGIHEDIEQFSSGGNTLDRENILDLISVVDALRAENERLRAAYRVVGPICRECHEQLDPDDVLAIEQPGEDGVWMHVACQN